VPDDEKRRRLGDETKSRIANLSDGWTIDPKPAEPVAAEPSDKPDPAKPPRKKPRTIPPPPPGSEARKALEDAIIDAKDSAPVPRIELGDVAREGSGASPPAESRSKPTTSPPPLPRAKTPPTSPPPIPKAGVSNKSAPQTALPDARISSPLLPEDSGAATIPDSVPPAPSRPLTVPVGEFDGAARTVDDEALRRATNQATIKRDAVEGLLKMPPPVPTVVKETPIGVLLGEAVAGGRADPTSIDPQTSPFARGDATATQPPSLGRRAPSGTLRNTAAIRRQRGIGGDVRYVFTSQLGLRRSRRELAELEDRQATRKTSRRHHLVTLGRTAVTADGFDHPALGKAREALATVEEERSQHAGAVAAADTELDRVRRDREAKAKQFVVDVAAIEAELVALAKKQEPLDKEAAVIKKRSGELRDALRRVARQLEATEAKLVSVKGDKLDQAAIHAELATLKADRAAVQRDEPQLAAELDALNPRIAAIEASRSDAQTKRRELEQAEKDDQRRTSELLEAIGAKRKVVERAAADAEVARDRVLFELGERLYHDRPQNLAGQLSPIDQIDLELGESDRRVMELREIMSNIDRAKLWRGILVIAGFVVVIGAMIGWMIYMIV
jgi:hypothetical protein